MGPAHKGYGVTEEMWKAGGEALVEAVLKQNPKADKKALAEFYASVSGGIRSGM